MKKKFIPPFHEVLVEDSAKNIKENLDFLLRLYESRASDFHRIRYGFFLYKNDPNMDLTPAVKQMKDHCADIWLTISKINHSYDKLDHHQRQDLENIGEQEKKTVLAFARILELYMFEQTDDNFEYERSRSPTSLYTVATAKTALERAVFMKENGFEAEKAEAENKIRKLKRYLSLERSLRYRYMPQLIEVEKHLDGNPMKNLEFLDEIFKNSIEKVRYLNVFARKIVQMDNINSDDVWMLNKCYQENEKMFAIIYASNENLQHALLSGRMSKEFNLDKVKYDLIETQCQIAEAAGKLR